MSFAAQKYAELLNKDDLIQLFGLLTEAVGTRKEAAKLCGITRKTTYDWNNIGDLKGETKEKALDALIEELPKETFQKLTDRSYRLSREVAMTYLSVLRSSLGQAKTMDEFKLSLSMLDSALQRYAGLLIGAYDEEIATLLLDVGRQVELRRGDWYPKPSPVIHETEFERLVPEIMASIESGQDVTTISRELRAPISIVSSIYALAKASIPVIGLADRTHNFDAFVVSSSPTYPNSTEPAMIRANLNSESGTRNQAMLRVVRYATQDSLAQNRQSRPVIIAAQGR